MWSNYLKVAFRALMRNRIYTIINLLGLSLGIAVCMLIFLYTRHEFSYNHYFADADQLYRVVSESTREGVVEDKSGEVSALFAETFNEGIPGLEGVSRVLNVEDMVRVDQAVFNENYLFVDPNFPQLFGLNAIEGDLYSALEDREGVVITEGLARKYFGTGSAIGRRLDVNLIDQMGSFYVRAIVEDPPAATTLPFQLLVPFVYVKENLASHLKEGWQVTYSESYAKLASNADLDAVETSIAHALRKIDQEEEENASGEVRSYHFQPIKDIHLAFDNPHGWPTETGVSGPLILLAIGLGVLLIACINFTTLAIGRSTTRALEVGVRKVMGAHRHQIMRQFWLEISLLSLFALLIGWGVTELLLPAFSTMAERTISLQLDATMLIGALTIWLLVVLAAGSYPAIVMSGFTPINAIRGHLRVGGKARLRQVLVFVQFSVAASLVAITLIMASQLNYINGKELGYKGDQVVEFPVASLDSTGALITDRAGEVFRADPGVLDVTAISCSFDANFWTRLTWQGDDGTIYENVHTNCVKPNFIDVMGINLKAGRNFEDGNSWDQAHALLVNQAMVDYMGWENPIGQHIPGLADVEVIGVVDDFHYASLHEKVEPLILQLNPNVLFRQPIGASSPNWFTIQSMLIRLAGDDIPGTMRRIERAWPELAPDHQFVYEFVDSQVGEMYGEEQRWSTIVRLASLFTIVIAALGLLGLATLEVQQRTREIGIRKALGAGEHHIVFLLTRQITLIVLAGTVVAWPVAWFSMQRWLENFAYKVSLSPLLLLLATLIAVLVAWGTVGTLAWRAANNNPTASLRHE